MVKSKGNPALIELVIVIFFFSVSSITIVKLFMASYEISEKSKSETLAIIKIQEIAEHFKSNPEMIDTLIEDWEENENRYTAYFDGEMNIADRENAAYIIEVTIDQQVKSSGRYIKLQSIAYENTDNKKVVFQINCACYVPEAFS